MTVRFSRIPQPCGESGCNLAPAPRLGRNQRWALGRLCLAHFWVDGYSAFLFPLLPLLQPRLGFDLQAAGWLSLVASVCSYLLQPFYGWLADRYPTRNWVLPGVLLAASLSFIGLSPSYPVLMAWVVVGYVGVGLFHPQGTTLTFGLSARHQNRTMGWLMGMGTLGFSAGPMLVAALSVHGAQPAGLAWATLGGLGSLLLLLGLQFLQPYTVAGLTTPEDPAAPERQVRQTFTPEGPGFSQPVKMLALLSLNNTARAFVLMTLSTFLPFLLRERGVEQTTIIMVLSLSALAGAPFGVLGGWLADRFGERNTIVWTFLPGFLLLPLIIQASGPVSYAAAILLSGLMIASLGTTTVLGFRSIRARPNLTCGLVAGFSFGLAGLLLPAMGGLSDGVGIPNALFVLYPALLLGVLSAIALPRPEPQADPSAPDLTASPQPAT
jgi:FSR family fosmidomycin resistance protein-like MFS transporter